MCCQSTLFLESKDYLILFIGFLLSGFWPFILYILKPNIKITSADLDKTSTKKESVLKIKVKNKGCSDAVNLKFEVCIVTELGSTYHLSSDRDEFLILPASKNNDVASRDFKIRGLSDSASHYGTDYESLISNLTKNGSPLSLRVRVHACHSYSGFGKAFEQNFKYSNGEFKKEFK